MNGWKNVTDCVIQPLWSTIGICQLIPAGRRGTINPLDLFLRLFSNDMLDHIAAQTQLAWSVKKEHTRGPTMNVTSQDILGIITIFLSLCGTKEKSLKSVVRDVNRKGIPSKRYEKLRSVFAFDISTIIDIFNRNLKLGSPQTAHVLVEK
jgi:hypothetical protein